MAVVLLLLVQLLHLVLSVSVTNAGTSTSNVLAHRHLRAVATKLANHGEPLSERANDLWALHDLLLIGYHGVFLAPHSPAKREVRDHATSLAKLLPSVHPLKLCRNVIAQVIGKSEKPNISTVAEAAWACLPAKFSAADFDQAFLKETDTAAAKMPHPKEPEILGACKGSGWPRTCSYWVALHLMAFRADGLQLGAEFLHAVVPLLAGGALVCNGCTQHLMALHRPVLSESMLRDRSNEL